MNKKLTVSVVIPAYNEENGITKCLESIHAQTVKADEVILVDNNCSDNTAMIASQYSFVTIIKETNQGTIHARNTGFNKARGDILIRIDADSILCPEWIENAIYLFEDNDTFGVTGPIAVDWLPFMHTWLKTTAWMRFYYYWSEFIFGVRIMSGANMAIRRTSWNKIQHRASRDIYGVHEDQDLSILMAGINQRIINFSGLLVEIDPSKYHPSPKFFAYFKLQMRTKLLHNHKNTLKNSLQKIGVLRRSVYLLVSVIPCGLFVITSVIFMPFYAFANLKFRSSSTYYNRIVKFLQQDI